jgi:hypothetical protein
MCSFQSNYLEERMKNKLFKLLALFAMASMMLTACGGGA